MKELMKWSFLSIILGNIIDHEITLQWFPVVDKDVTHIDIDGASIELALFKTETKSEALWLSWVDENTCIHTVYPIEDMIIQNERDLFYLANEKIKESNLNLKIEGLC